MRRLMAATLCTLVSAQAIAANLSDVNKVIEKLERQGRKEQSACKPPIYARSLMFDKAVLNGQKYDRVIASYLTGINAPNRILVFQYAQITGGHYIYLSEVRDGDETGMKLDGQPDLAFERNFDIENSSDVKLLNSLLDYCSFEKSLETVGTKPNEKQRQLYDASVSFVLSR